MQPPPLPMNPYSAPQASVHDPVVHYSTEFQYAGFWLRFVALIIDSIVSSAILFVIALIAGVVLGLVLAGAGASSSEQIEFYGNFVGVVLALILPWLYYASCEASSWQATPGKKALGLRVTDLDGAPIGFARASGRFWGKLVSYLIIYIGFMMAGWTEKKQGLHDMMAGTLVIKG